MFFLIWILTQGCFVPSFVEIGSVVLEKNFRQCNFAISLLSPLEKGRGISFEQTWFPFTQASFKPILVEIWHSGSGDEVENMKVYDNDDG